MATKLVIKETNGQIEGGILWEGASAVEWSGAQVWQSPLAAADLDDIRWYLEEYLVAPFAVWEDRGRDIAAKLPSLGERLFDSLFGVGKPGHDPYVEVARGNDYSIRIVSDSPEFLALPWELVRDPARNEYPAAAGVDITREVAVGAKATSAGHGETLRVLMVISRPAGRDDVRYRISARPLIERLEKVRGRVELEVLRPPTFAALAERLRAARDNDDERPFDILHFDGHGAFGVPTPGGATSRLMKNAAAQGYLLFERDGGGDDPVSAEQLAALLKRHDIRVLIFDACQTAMLARGGGATVGTEAGIATRMLGNGADAVVAMGYSVYAVAAAEFMSIFYDELFKGRFVAQAVAAGRQQMRHANLRPSPKGDLPLEDWFVPVHYAHREVSFPQLKVEAAERGDLAQTLAELRGNADRGEAVAADDDPLRAQGGVFVGRDREFYALERACQDGGVTVIHGVGGVGKTELVKAFARWLRDSGGLDDPRAIFVHSFEPGVESFGVDGMVTQLGMHLRGVEFVRDFPEPGQRRDVIVELLRKHRILLILDNFETVHSMPEPTQQTPPLEGQALADMKAFIEAVAADSEGNILITSRSDESWLSKDVRRIKLGGLAARDAAEYADCLLPARSAAQRQRDERAYGELIKHLQGHPLCMRLILPHLENNSAADLLAGLKGQGDLPPGFQESAGRLGALGESVHYSFRTLPAEAQRRLPALAVFEGVADVVVLGVLSKLDDVPERFAGLDTDAWGGLLAGCRRIGLVSPTSISSAFTMHPALPAYLVALWREQAGDAFEVELDSARLAGMKAHAHFGDWLDEQIEGGRAETAMAMLALEWRSLAAAAGQALERRLFDEAQSILQPLDDYWNARGLRIEADRWADRVWAATEDPSGNPPDFDAPAGALWLFTTTARANRMRLFGELKGAHAVYDSMRKALESSDSGDAPRRLAVVYHQLGVVAQHRGDLRSAEDWYRKSLAINEELGDRPGMAGTYHQLGRVAQDRGDLRSAEDWYRKSLAILEELTDRPNIASSYHQLGVVAQLRGDLKAAEDWCRKSLAIKEELGDRAGIANSYHQLGVVAQLRSDLMSAEDWYRESLAIREDLGDRPRMATSYGQLGLLAEQRGEVQEALKWTVRCVGLFDEFPHPLTGPGPRHLARLTATLGMEALEGAWQECTGKPLPDNVRQFVTAAIKKRLWEEDE